MKKDKLYTVNPWNKRRFNSFGNGGFEELAFADAKANPWNYTQDYLYDSNAPDLVDQYKSQKGGLFGLTKADNPFSKGNISGGAKAMASTPIGGALLTAGAGIVGNAAYKGISGGLNSGAGSAINSLGSTAGGIVGQFSPLLGAAITTGSGVVGGGVNALVGTKVNAKKKAANDDIIARGNNVHYTAEDPDTLLAQQQAVGPFAKIQNAYTGGLAKKRWARRKNREVREAGKNAVLFADRSFTNAAGNIEADQLSNNLATYAAFGGPIETIGNMDGAIGYDFMSRYLDNYKSKNTQSDKVSSLFAGMPNSAFALGGDLQSHGADWSSGLTYVNAGGSHEGNPNDGVQMGVDGEGVPNLVEEGEVVFNDFVFSNRIFVNDAVKRRIHLPRKKDMTYADVAKKLEKEASERPNDPISKASLKRMLNELAEMQEAQKKEMEAERAREAFEALSPEEKVAVLQQHAEQKAAEEEMMRQQQMAAQEQAMVPQEMTGQEETVPQEGMACGGKMKAEGGELNGEANVYAEAGPLKNAGTWKEGSIADNWWTYSMPGLEDYLNNILARIEAAPDEKAKNEIRQEAINTVGSIQQAYRDAYQSSITPSEYSAKVEDLQKKFQNAKGNAHFAKIAENINVPTGANTADREGTWVDGYWGPRTSIRNWGSTEFGDNSVYAPLAALAEKAGLVYAPNEEWTYGENGANRLYGLSMPEATRVAGIPEESASFRDPVFLPKGPVDTGEEDVKAPTAATSAGGNGKEDDLEFVPKHKYEGLRYAGLFGPAVGLGMMAAGVGKPDYSGLSAAVEMGNQPIHLAKWKPIGNYLTYKPMDIWFEQNKMDANARATDRAIMNSTSPSRMAGLIANGYNSQLADGELYRKALEYNDAQKKAVEEFNRGTNQYNSQAYQRNSEFNADALNRNRQYQAQLAMNAARTKMDADAGWYNSIYGNIAGFTKGLGELGRENKEYNMMVDLLASGAIPGVDYDKLAKAGMGKMVKKKAAEGGKIRKRKGLTF